MKEYRLNRRAFLGHVSALPLLTALPAAKLAAQENQPIMRTIPSSGEQIVIMGMGSSRTFNRGDEPDTRRELIQVLQTFFDMGGQVVDSAPMYGPAERIIGELLNEVNNKDGLFCATKVLSHGKDKGVEQMNRSIELMGIEPMDLIAVHNLVDWKTQLATLREWKEAGRVRYIGITTFRGRDHREFEQIMQSEPIDFVQFTYNVQNRKAEERLLPLARDKGIATMINVPFQRGELFSLVKGKPLPDWAEEAGIASWAQYFLKFVAAHPDVTTIIPATSKVRHMRDNMGANFGPLPDESMRTRMVAHIESL